MDAMHRVLVGQTLSRRELVTAGVVVILWIVIDVIQFADWAWTKLDPPQTQTVVCVPAPVRAPNTRERLLDLRR